MRWTRRVQYTVGVCLLAATCGCAGPRAATQSTAPGDIPATLPPERAQFAEALARYGLAVSQEWSRQGEAAFTNFMRAAELDPDNEELQFRVALGLIRDQRGPEAQALMEQLAKRRPRSDRAQVWTAFVLRLLGQPEAALAYYDQALKVAPDAPLPYLEKAALLIRLDRTDDAIALLQTGVNKVNDGEDLARMLAQLLVRRAAAMTDRTAAAKAAGDALRVLEPAVAAGVRDEPLLMQVVLLRKLAGQYEAALLALEDMDARRAPPDQWRQRRLTAVFGREDLPAARLAMQALVEQQPGNVRRLLALGHLNEQAGDIAGAENAFRRAQEADPSNVAPPLRLALLLTGAHRTDDAVEVLEDALAQHPQETKFIELLAYLEMSRERAGAALDYFARATARFAETGDEPMTPHFEISHAMANLQGGKPDDAALRLKAALEKDPEFLDVFARMLLRERDAKKQRQGLAAMRRLSELDPENPGVFVYLGLVASYAKAYPESLAAFARAMELAKELDAEGEILTASFYFWYGAAYERIGRIEEAAEMFKRCIALEPKPTQRQDYSAYVDALNYLAYMWAERGLELETGLELINRALAIQPDNPAYIDTRGWIYYMMGRYPEAREDIERAVALLPDDPTLTDHLGDIYEKLAVIEEAIDWWSQSFILDPANEKVAAKLEAQGVDLAPLREKAAARKAELPEDAAPTLLAPPLFDGEVEPDVDIDAEM
ncbi:MAG TPA: tetratricopeptide repeat protein [Kiritimatiellia bacterium]|nr:tetratricopeptide repeat protein [Kiritimatiellia bacterium]